MTFRLSVNILLYIISCLTIRVFLSSVGVRLADASVGVLPNARSVREQDVLLSIRELYGLDAVLLNALDGPVREDALLLAVRKYALNRPVRETMAVKGKPAYMISLVPSGKCFSI